jgi:hypothetical protein
LLCCADLPFNETRHNYAERVVGSARRLVLPLLKKNRMLSARLAWSRLAVHVVQLLNWAFQEVKPEMLPLYVSLAWDLTPLLSSSCSSHTLQGEPSLSPGTDAWVVACTPSCDCCCSDGWKKQQPEKNPTPGLPGVDPRSMQLLLLCISRRLLPDGA